MTRFINRYYLSGRPTQYTGFRPINLMEYPHARTFGQKVSDSIAGFAGMERTPRKVLRVAVRAHAEQTGASKLLTHIATALRMCCARDGTVLPFR